MPVDAEAEAPVRRFPAPAVELAVEVDISSSSSSATELPVGGEEACRMCTRSVGHEEQPEILHCGHSFHRRCIRRWLRVNLACPVCNSTQIGLSGEVDGEASPPRQRHLRSSSDVELPAASADDSVTATARWSFQSSRHNFAPDIE